MIRGQICQSTGSSSANNEHITAGRPSAPELSGDCMAHIVGQWVVFSNVFSSSTSDYMGILFFRFFFLGILQVLPLVMDEERGRKPLLCLCVVFVYISTQLSSLAPAAIQKPIVRHQSEFLKQLSLNGFQNRLHECLLSKPDSQTMNSIC